MIVSKTSAEKWLGKKLKSAWPKGSGKRSYYLLSSTGEKNLGGPYKTKAEARNRERQVVYFRDRKKNPVNIYYPWGDRDHDWDQPLALDGTSRGDILSHYDERGRYMLPYLQGRDVIVVLGLGDGEFVYRRKGPDGKPIRISKLDGETPDALEYWTMRRGVEFHPTIGKMTDRVWIDIDVHATKQNMRKARARVQKEIPYLESLLRKLFKGKIRVYSSGKGAGTHIVMTVPNKINTDKARRKILDALKEEYHDDEIVTTKPCKKKNLCIRLDVTTLKNTGSLKAPYSYSIKGGYKRSQ